MATWLWVQSVNSSCLNSLLDEGYCKKNSDLILFNSWSIALSTYNPTMPSFIHFIFFLSIVHLSKKVQIFIYVSKKDFIDGSIYFSLLFIPIFGPTYKILQYYTCFECQAPSQASTKFIKILCHDV